jgi:flagellar hook-basal body protein
MSFYTSLTGLNAATAQLGVTSNNIANVSTTGFKRSRTDFGDIFATSPLQKASATIGQGVSLKRVVQEFGQGNMMFSSNTLDLAISGDGFFPLKSQDGFQDIFTRNGVFMMNDQYNVVNSAGQRLMAASVDSSGKANLNDMNVLTIPQKTTGMAKQTSKVQLGLNFPADAEVISKEFNRNDPETYNKSTALTVYDAGGNSYLASVYYVKTQNATQETPNNKWQTYVYVGDKLVSASLQQATNSQGEVMYVNKYGELKAKSDFKTPAEIEELNNSFAKKTIKFSLDELTDVRTSQPATVIGGSAINLGTGTNDGVDMSTFNGLSKSDLLVKQGSNSADFDVNVRVAADAYTVTFNQNLNNGPEPVKVNVPTVGTTAPTVSDVVKALNANAAFAADYVAQNTTTAMIGAPTFADTPSVSDFSGFEIEIGGKSLVLANLSPATSDISGLAKELQERLRSVDGGNSSISVSVAPNGNDLKITDAAGRNITSAALKLNPDLLAGSGASIGHDAVITTGVLRITSIDPNVPDETILSDVTVSKTVGGVPGDISGKGLPTDFPRSTANYTFNAAASLFNAKFGPASDPISVTEKSLTAFADSLNKNTTFSASYKASISDGVLSVTAVSPSDSAAAINTALTINQTVGGISEKISGAARTAAEFTVADGPYAMSFDGIEIKSNGTVTQNGAPASTEESVVTFEDMVEDQTLTIGGLTFKAAAAKTAAEVAALFLSPSSVTSGDGTFTGSLSGFAASAVSGHTDQLTFTSQTDGADVTDLDVSGGLSLSTQLTTVQGGTGKVTENARVTFQDLTAGQTMIIGGRTFTAGLTGATAAQVATSFITGTATNGAFTGALQGYAAAVVSGSPTKADFTSTTTYTNVSDLTPSGTGSASAVITQGATGVKENTSVTFPGSLEAGQSVTLGGLTFTSKGTTTKEELAELYSGLTAGATTSVQTTTKGSFTGALTGFNTGNYANASSSVTFTSIAAAGQDVTDLTVTGEFDFIPGVTTAQGSAATTENTTVTFHDLSTNQSVTVGALTLLATEDMTAEEVAAAFANLTPTSVIENPAKGSFSGSLTGFTSSEADVNSVKFKSDTDATNMGNLNVEGIDLDPDEYLALLNKSTLFTDKYEANMVGGNLKIMAKDLTVTGDTIKSDVVFKQGAAATVTTASVVGAGVTIDQTFAGLSSVDDLKELFSVNVDGSINPVTIGLERLAGKDMKLSGAQIAQELTNAINRAYGDERPFNFSALTGTTFSVQLDRAGGLQSPDPLDIDLSQAGDADKNMRSEDLVASVQAAIDANPDYKGKVTASYDTKLQKLVFTPSGNDKITITSTQSSIGLTDPLVQGVNDDSVGFVLAPSISTSSFRAPNDQRYGAKVEYDAVKGGFVFMSGTTGDTSSIKITNIRPNSLATQSSKGLGMTGDASKYTVDQSKIDALRGIESLPAVLTGNALGVNVDNNFSVDETNNKFVVSVNGVTGTVVVPPKDTYTLGTFMEALQAGINGLQGESKDGLTPKTIDGVKVSYDTDKNALVFTTGTASTDSYVKITGDARWGLDGLDAQFGSTTTWIKPTSFQDEKGATVYIDGFGQESSTASGFDTLPPWSPVYFDKGELTFDTAGNLVSPKQGAQLDTVYLPNGKGALTINIDYSKSTQFASPFSVLSQSQDGAPEGDLVGLAIADDGLVSASFSNGAQKSLGKVVLVNFSNPSGLRQIGDTNYYKTSDSGTPKYGEAGSAGFGTVRSGATERANVDLTQELVDLITEQRNFQANAKAMETSTSMTQTIIQIRN